MLGNPTPHHHVPFSETHDLMKIRQSLLCTRSSTQNTTCTKKPGNMAKYNTMTTLGPIMSESCLTGPTHPHYRIYMTNYHNPQEFNYNTLTNITNYNKVVPKYFYNSFYTQYKLELVCSKLRYKKLITSHNPAFFITAASSERCPPAYSLYLKGGSTMG